MNFSPSDDNVLKYMFQKIRDKFSQGSTLVFALMILAMMLTIAVTIAAVSSRERKLSIVNKDSARAFQVADSGAEIVVKKIKGADTTQTIESIFSDCKEGKFTGEAAGGTYTVTFLDQNDQELRCNDTIDKVISYKSVGNYSSTLRAIQAAVAHTDNESCKWFREDILSSACDNSYCIKYVCENESDNVPDHAQSQHPTANEACRRLWGGWAVTFWAKYCNYLKYAPGKEYDILTGKFQSYRCERHGCFNLPTFITTLYCCR